MSDSSSESSSRVMSEDSTELMVEVLETLIQDLNTENEELKTKVKQLEDRIQTFQNIKDSDIIIKVFSYL